MDQNKTNYETNRSSLKTNHPDIFKRIDRSEIEPCGELVTSQDGDINLKITTEDGNEHFIHGMTGPSEDTAQFLDMISVDASGVVVMMGMGLGLPCIEILKTRPKLRHLFIFEINIGIFKQALYTNDLSELFSDNRVVFCIETQPNLNALFSCAAKALELEDIQIIKHSASFKLEPNYSSLAETIFSYLNSFSVRGATTKALGKKFVRNRLKNLKRIRNDSTVDSLKNIFKDIPAILIAGGPSLDKNIEQLKNATKNAILFAVDSVVPTLLKKGIIPDFTAAIDPQRITLEKFKGVKLPPDGISIICSAWVAPEVPFHLPIERVIWTFGGRNIEIWINSALGGKSTYIGAGTVAHLNLHAAMTMGCSPIAFVGQDLAYSESKDHVKNVVLNNNTEMEKILASKNDWRFVKGIHGGQVKTSRSFYNHKKVFEDVIKQTKNIKFINATEGGAHIEGTEVSSLKEVLENMPPLAFSKKEHISQHAAPFSEKAIEALDTQFEKMLEIGSDIQKTIKAATNLSTELKKSIVKLKRKSNPAETFSELPQKIQKKLQKIDTFSKDIDNKEIFWHVLDEVTYEGLKQSETMLHDIGIHAKDTRHYLDWILKNIERLEYINEVRSEIIDWLKADLSNILNFHKKENQLLHSLKESGNSSIGMKAVSRFYFKHGITSLAVKQIQGMDNFQQDADLQYILACSSAILGSNEDAEVFFQKALSISDSIEPEIENFKLKQAKEYLQFGKKWKTIDRGTTRELFIKGLKYQRENQELLKELTLLLNEDLEKVRLLLEKQTFQDARKIIVPWMEKIESEPMLHQMLDKQKQAYIYGFSGKILISENCMEEAYDLFIKAAECDPNNADHYIQITDLCFTVADYDKGVAALNVAVRLDRSNARYWEIIGDNMAASNSFDDALSAYEKCLMEMPENFHLIKKMGDVYLAAGKKEAAHEAFLQYEKKLKQANEGH